MPTDAELHATITAAVKRRLPAMLCGQAFVTPSAEEAYFMGIVLEEETKKLGLPGHWYLKYSLAKHDQQEAKTLPYKCATCGRRHKTSDKRNECCKAVSP